MTLQIFVQEGRVVWVEVLASSGHNLLDGSAKQWALHRWRFPGISSGSFTEAVIFSLDGV
ncbi:MAG: energy transducer TonB [Methylacidiphilaceae bacterium]|nr:energy transducer TonB [Candidatus Methylacidiphilaceae bacterium]